MALLLEKRHLWMELCNFVQLPWMHIEYVQTEPVSLVQFADCSRYSKTCAS